MNKDELTERIEKLAAAYTPEWRFSSEQPDFGSSLALLFAQLLSESYENFSLIMQNRQVNFLNCLDADLNGGSASEGYITFDLVKPDMPAATVPERTGVEGSAEDGQRILFETLSDVAVTPSVVEPRPYMSDGMLYLKLTLPLLESLHNLLVLVKGGKETGKRRLVWEYESSNGFLPFVAEDNTNELNRTGIVRFTKLENMAQKEHFDELGWWLRIRDIYGSDLPQSFRFYLNASAVRAVDGGTLGNLLPFSELKLMKTIGFVSVIRNPDVLYGGTEAETKEEALKRYSARLKHRGQAVTPGDFEALIREISLNIEKVKCFSGIDRKGAKAPGFVTAAVLSKDYETGRNYFYHLREALLNGFKELASPCLIEGKRLEIVAPWFIVTCVDVTITTDNWSNIIRLQSSVLTAIEAYLNPVAGGNDGGGWEFGSLPSHSQLTHMLQKIPGVTFVKRLSITSVLEAEDSVREIRYEEAKYFPFSLPLSGKHQVTVLME